MQIRTPMVEHIVKVARFCFSNNFLPPRMREALISILYKGKGDRELCKSYRPVSLTDITCRVIDKMIQLALNEVVESALCGVNKAFLPKRCMDDNTLSRAEVARHCHHQGTHSLTPTRMHGISVGSEFVAATGGSVEEAEGSVAAKASGRRRKPRAPVENTAARSSNVRKRMFSRCSFGFGPIFGCSFH